MEFVAVVRVKGTKNRKKRMAIGEEKKLKIPTATKYRPKNTFIFFSNSCGDNN